MTGRADDGGQVLDDVDDEPRSPRQDRRRGAIFRDEWDYLDNGAGYEPPLEPNQRRA